MTYRLYGPPKNQRICPTNPSTRKSRSRCRLSNTGRSITSSSIGSSTNQWPKNQRESIHRRSRCSNRSRRSISVRLSSPLPNSKRCRRSLPNIITLRCGGRSNAHSSKSFSTAFLSVSNSIRRLLPLTDAVRTNSLHNHLRLYSYERSANKLNVEIDRPSGCCRI